MTWSPRWTELTTINRVKPAVVILATSLIELTLGVAVAQWLAVLAVGPGHVLSNIPL